MTRLEPRSIDKHKLLVFACQNAVNAMTDSLRFTRNDGNLAAYQRIGQCGFAHVGSTDNGDKATAKRSTHLFSWETATGSDSCADLRARRAAEPLPGPKA